MTQFAFRALLGGISLLAGGSVFAQDATLTIESWRDDDLAIWQKTIIPAFETSHPGIRLTFSPSAPAGYDAALNSKLDAGTAGDIIACRPFDASLGLFQKGQLADLSGLAAMANFPDIAKTAWSTDDGAQTFCVPMAGVIHGFIYNRTAFAELGLTPPKTEAEFFAVLDKIKADGGYIPMAMGTKDQWSAATMGYQNIGPSFWKGEEGRLALIRGEQKLTDEPWVAPFREIAKWKDYLGDGFEARTYIDSQNLFALGRAAIYPAGSWEIGPLEAQIQGAFEMGAFPPPVFAEGDACYISDHPDIAMGINAATKNADAAKAFLEWVGTPEFATLYANALPGFFPLLNAPVTIRNPLAKEFISWRATCHSTIRATYQILSRGTPNLESETWTVAADVVRGAETPEAAAARLQQGLASWYDPQGK